jgi:NADH-quinone oxidoreductase subunit E
MSVRRLDPVQPVSFAFSAENATWAKKQFAQYPQGKQASAVIALLWRAQEQAGGWLSKPAMEYVAEMLDLSFIRVYEVATFYTMFQLSPVGRKAHVQVCGTTPCMLRGSEDLMSVCRRRIHANPHRISADGDFSWEEVECLGACVNAPMVQIWKDTYEDLTPASFEALLDDIAADKPVMAGPQNGRQFSAPEGGPTTLTDRSLYANGRTYKRMEAPPPPAAAPAPPVVPVAAPVAAPPPLPAPAPVAAVAPAPVVKPVEATPVMAKHTPAPEPMKLVEVPKPPEAKPAPKKAEPKKEPGKPELLKKPRSGKGDDLKLIWGVGPALEKMLNKMGIWHFDQIASWKAQDLKWVDERLEGFKGRAKRDEWIKQARQLAKGWRPSSAIGDKPKGKG